MRGQFGSTLNSFALTNLVTNGNFASGTTGWTGNGGTLSSAANILSFTANNIGNTPYFQSGVLLATITSPRRIYTRMLAMVTNSNCTQILSNARYGNTGEGTTISGTSSIINPIQNTWYKLSSIVEFKNTDTYWAQQNIMVIGQHQYVDAATANGKIMQVQQIMAIDMGTNSSNPLYNLTVDQMNARTQYWFDGTKSTLSINSPLRSL